jgi:hypothetical protein
MHRARGARVRARAAREGRRDESTGAHSGAKLKIRQTGALGNLLLFPSMGRGTRESKYRRRKVVYNNCPKSLDLVSYPPCNRFSTPIWPRGSQVRSQNESQLPGSTDVLVCWKYMCARWPHNNLCCV